MFGVMHQKTLGGHNFKEGVNHCPFQIIITPVIRENPYLIDNFFITNRRE